MKISIEDAQSIMWGDPPDNWTILEDRIVGTSRWSVHHQVVLRDVHDNLWGMEYAIGATEYQDLSLNEQLDAWHGLVDLYPVRAVQTTTYEKA